VHKVSTESLQIPLMGGGHQDEGVESPRDVRDGSMHISSFLDTAHYYDIFEFSNKPSPPLSDDFVDDEYSQVHAQAAPAWLR
jgi:hypothetical protein